MTPFWVSNYMVVDGLISQDNITVRFPMVEQTVVYNVPDDEFIPPERGGEGELKSTRYTCYFKGNPLVDISSRDEISEYPIYCREKFKTSDVSIQDTICYVSPHTISW